MILQKTMADNSNYYYSKWNDAILEKKKERKEYLGWNTNYNKYTQFY